MKMKTLGICLALSALGSINQAWAVGEVLKLDTFGTKYCADQAPIEVDPTNTAPYWIKVDSNTQVTIYLDAGLTIKAFTLPVTLTTLPDDDNGKGQSALSILGTSSNGYLALNGIAKTNKAKTFINYLKLNFVRRGLTDTCSASGYMVGRRVP